MSYKITMKTPVNALSLSNSEKGEDVTYVRNGFFTDQHGELFYEALKGAENLFLKQWLEKGLPYSVIDSYLILIRNDEANIFINEPDIVCESISRHDIEAGQSITMEDVIGITSLKFREIDISNLNGIIYYFSIGWKRGLYFNLNLRDNNDITKLSYMLGVARESLLYSHIYQYDIDIWKQLFETGWFPFISLLGDADKILKHMLGRIKEGKTIDEVENRLIDFFNIDKLDGIANRINNNDEMIPHQKIIETGIERYLAEDYVSSINNIYPRIEGILRYIYITIRSDKETIKKLADNIYDVIANKTTSPGVFFPEYFRNYLLSFYFKSFDLQSRQLDVSRHSIAHGVSDVDLYDRKHALLGILMVDQLGFYLRRIIEK